MPTCFPYCAAALLLLANASLGHSAPHDRRPAVTRDAPAGEIRYTTNILTADGLAAAAGIVYGSMLTWCIDETLFRASDHDSCTVAGGAAIASLGTYALASPVIHLAHGRPTAAITSFALRVGLPSALGFLGHQLNDGFAAGGVVVGALVAMGIDWNTLSVYESAATFPVTPTIAANRDGATFGVGGSF